MSTPMETSAEARPGLVERAEAEFEASKLRGQFAEETAILTGFQTKATQLEQPPEGVLDDDAALEAYIKAKSESVARMEIQRAKVARLRHQLEAAEKKARDALIAYSYEHAGRALAAAKARFEADYPRILAELSDLLDEAMDAEALLHEANRLAGFAATTSLASVFKPGGIVRGAKLEIVLLDAGGREVWLGHADSWPESRHGYSLRLF